MSRSSAGRSGELMRLAQWMILVTSVTAGPAFAEMQIEYGTPERVTVEPAHVTPGTPTKVIYDNPDASGRAVYVHYGVNGWNLRIGGEGAGSETDTGNLNHFVRKPMRLDPATGRFEAELTVPAGARALHFAFCFDSCRVGDWDNNGEKDYSWPVVFPYIGPVLTWNEQTHPSSGVVVAFENSWAAPAWIEYGVTGQAPRRLVSTAGLVHRFALSGLAANTTYRYRVGVGTDFVSPYHQFKTAKTFSGLDRFSFVVFGDAQDNGENGRFGRLMDEVAAHHPDVDFIVSTGDLPWNDKAGDWWSFFDKARGLFASKVVMPAIGNHDTPTVDSSSDHRSFLRYFDLPETDAQRGYYRFTYGPAEFYAMNSERPEELAPGGVQYRWIADLLAHRTQRIQQTARPTWTFAFWHIPPFNAGERHYTQQYQHRDVAGLFDGVLDWHFGGHEHLYQRMKPIKNAGDDPEIVSRYGLSSDKGVGYLVVPSAGVPGGADLVSVADRPELRERLAFPVVARDVVRVEQFVGYTRVDIRGSAVDLKVYSLPATGDAPAAIIDRVQYDKSVR